MTFPNYYRDEIRSQAVYRCCSCAHDTFDPLAAKAHQSYHNTPVPLAYQLKLEDWLEVVKFQLRPMGNVVIGVLTCNDGAAAIKSIRAADDECKRLNDLGYECHIIWVDNGSIVNPMLGHMIESSIHVVTNQVNFGQSVARNQIIEHCIEELADWLIMVDGDITLIPYSGHALIQEARDQKVECVGLFSPNCSDGDDIAHECRSLADLTVPNEDLIAWTQYGAFDCQMFRNGLRFDEADPFKGEGWGFEDDDFGLQMVAKRYKIRNSKHFRYGHYRRHSSLRRMDPTLAAKVYTDRREYVYAKWKSCPNYEIARAAAVLNLQTPPVL